jgi:hypothetical protein
MQRKLNRVSRTYLFTISMNSQEDLDALADLRRVAKERRQESQNFIKSLKPWHELVVKPEMPRVKVYFRKPTKAYDNKGRLYGWGGSVRKEQNPTEADVYLAFQ